MASSTMRSVTLALAFLMCVLVLYVQSAPQMYEDDQQEVSDEHPVEIVEVVSEPLPLTRTRRGSQLASYGHHQPSYHQGHGHGHGHGQSHGHGHGHGHGWAHRPVGPVFTYVRTDYHGNFQWGVRHRAGGHGWQGR